MTDEELDAIQKRLEAATPGPWKVESPDSGSHSFDDCVYSHDGEFICGEIEGNSYNAEFIAHARTDVESLLAEVRRLHKFTPY